MTSALGTIQVLPSSLAMTSASIAPTWCTPRVWFMDVLGLSPFSAKQRAQLVRTILSIVDGAPLSIADPSTSLRA
jgi:hypothetical protein